MLAGRLLGAGLMARILFIPTPTGGWNLNPETETYYLDDLGLACHLEAQGHDVWMVEHFEHKHLLCRWQKTIPKFHELGISDDFDEVYVHPKFPGTMVFLANPALNHRTKLQDKGLLSLQELARFKGPIHCVTTDDRKPYLKAWEKDQRKFNEYHLGRGKTVMHREAFDLFPEIISRVQRRLFTDEQQRWGAKWCVENLLGRHVDKTHDLIVDGYNKWSNWSPERKEKVVELLAHNPNSATFGRLSIPGLPNLSDGEMVHGATNTFDLATRAKRISLTWEQFHLTNKVFWTVRTMLGMSSTSLAFTTMEGGPDCVPVFSPDSLPEPTTELIEAQHEALRRFAAKEPWPEALQLG